MSHTLTANSSIPRTPTSNDEDAHLEDLAVAGDLRELLRGHYSEIADDSPVDFARFTLHLSDD